MRFHRTKRSEVVGVNNRRLAHARKAVDKDKASWALFPEFVKHKTPEERIQAIDTGKVQWEQDFRSRKAANWRQARARLNAFPEPLRSQLLSYWNSRTMLPGDPGYLAGLLHSAEVGRFDPEKAERELERCRVLGAVTREVCASVVVPILPGEPIREVSFLRSHVARQIAQARAPHLFPPLESGEEMDVFESCRLAILT